MVGFLIFMLKLFLAFYGVYAVVASLMVTFAFPEKEGKRPLADGPAGLILLGIGGAIYFFVQGIDFHMAWGWYIPMILGVVLGIGVQVENMRKGCNGCPLLNPIIPLACALTGSKPMKNNYHWEDKSKIDKHWKDEA